MSSKEKTEIDSSRQVTYIKHKNRVIFEIKPCVTVHSSACCSGGHLHKVPVKEETSLPRKPHSRPPRWSSATGQTASLPSSRSEATKSRHFSESSGDSVYRQPTLVRQLACTCWLIQTLDIFFFFFFKTTTFLVQSAFSDDMVSFKHTHIPPSVQ